MGYTTEQKGSKEKAEEGIGCRYSRCMVEIRQSRRICAAKGNLTAEGEIKCKGRIIYRMSLNTPLYL